MSRDLVQARVDPDTVEALEDYSEDREISRSEAMRRALRDSLSNKGYLEGPGTQTARMGIETIDILILALLVTILIVLLV